MEAMNRLVMKPGQEEELAARVASVLGTGGLAILPTETVYGIFCSFDDERAIERVFKIKERSFTKVLSLTLADPSDIAEYAEVDEWQINTAKELMPGPVTLIFNARKNLPSFLLSDEKKVGIRIPDFELTRMVIVKHGRPLASTSANISGKEAPASFSEIEEVLLEKVDVAVDAGGCPLKVASTVYDLSSFPGKLIRSGFYPEEKIIEAARKYLGEK
jgi:L-threonylcarbamoyladenylate synthase